MLFTDMSLELQGSSREYIQENLGWAIRYELWKKTGNTAFTEENTHWNIMRRFLTLCCALMESKALRKHWSQHYSILHFSSGHRTHFEGGTVFSVRRRNTDRGSHYVRGVGATRGLRLRKSRKPHGSPALARPQKSRLTHRQKIHTHRPIPMLNNNDRISLCALSTVIIRYTRARQQRVPRSAQTTTPADAAINGLQSLSLG